MSRATAIFPILTVAVGLFLCNVVFAEEVLGWRIEWNTTVEGAGTVTWQTGIDPVETHSVSGTHYANFSGSYEIDANGIVISGSSSGSRTDTSHRERLDWVCGVGDNLQYVNSYGGSTFTESMTGGSAGSQVFYSEGLDPDTGEYSIRFTFPIASCSGESSWWSEDYDPGYCTPRNESGSYPTDSCWPPVDYRGTLGTAEDDTLLTFSGSGSDSAGCMFTDHYAATESCVGPITRTYQMTAEKIVVPSIHGIEFTQAIQVYQTLAELKYYLERNDGNPPVPLVAYKPLAIRVMLDKNEETTDYIVEAYWNGWELDESPFELKQSATCVPPDTSGEAVHSSRENLASDCRTADFYVEAPHPGLHEVRVILRTADGRLIADEVLHIQAKVSDTVVLGAVNICAARVPLPLGGWDCVPAPARQLERNVRLMREIYPTDTVDVQPTGHVIRLEITEDSNAAIMLQDDDQADCYDKDGNKVFNGHYDDSDKLVVDDWDPPTSRIVSCESGIWWDVAALRVDRLYGATNRLLEWLGGVQWFYYGLFNPQPLHENWTGQAFNIPEPYDSDDEDDLPDAIDPTRGAIGIADNETVAHEVGHLLGRRHTHRPADGNLVRCGAGDPDNWAWDDKTDYPKLYPNSRLWSGHPIPDEGPLKKEIGFHVQDRSIRDGTQYYDIMSYCTPKWITPFTYKKLHEVLDPPPIPPPGEVGSFWLVSGFVSGANAYIDAIYSMDTTGPIEEGSGTHRIEVYDGSGAVLFVRRLTPNVAQRDPMGPAASSRTGLSFFAELIPVQVAASRIVLVNETETEIADLELSGAAPAVSITFPNGGEQLDGPYEITWIATDPDTDAADLFYWVQYSPDGGNSWINLAQDVAETSAMIDFDLLPGSNNALVRVLGSDGTNTGSATSSLFSVSQKLPTVEIALPKHGQTVPVGTTIFFEGYGYDLEDGKVPDYMHDWSSSRDGLLRTGNRFSTADLSEGTHVIELLVIDAEGNMATDTIMLTVGESSDSDGDGVDDTLDDCPGTPVGEAVDASGCSASQRDGDGDGVSDANDQCPGTPAGTTVDNNGCTTSQPTASASGGGGGGGFGLVWAAFICSWIYVRWRLQGSRGSILQGTQAQSMSPLVQYPGAGNKKSGEPLSDCSWPLAVIQISPFQRL